MAIIQAIRAKMIETDESESSILNVRGKQRVLWTEAYTELTLSTDI